MPQRAKPIRCFCFMKSLSFGFDWQPLVDCQASLAKRVSGSSHILTGIRSREDSLARGVPADIISAALRAYKDTTVRGFRSSLTLLAPPSFLPLGIARGVLRRRIGGRQVVVGGSEEATVRATPVRAVVGPRRRGGTAD